jgi:hypothetical protein
MPELWAAVVVGADVMGRGSRRISASARKLAAPTAPGTSDGGGGAVSAGNATVLGAARETGGSRPAMPGRLEDTRGRVDDTAMTPAPAVEGGRGCVEGAPQAARAPRIGCGYVPRKRCSAWPSASRPA